MTTTHRPGPRTFDPVALGNHETDVWIAYYRRDWRRLLRSSVGMVRVGFGMNWPRTLLGAWFVLRANMVWAPYPDNDPDAARAFMRRFYALVRRDGHLAIDPERAAVLEVEWWRVHRIHQREDGISEDDLAAALVALYAYVYGVPGDSVQDAARERVLGMRLSDEWVAAGCDLADPLLITERAHLVAGYRALRQAVDPHSSARAVE